MDSSMAVGLSGKVLEYININSFNFDKSKNECSCIIIPKKECFNKNQIFDKGLLIAIADTFSSYVVKYLCPDEDFSNLGPDVQIPLDNCKETGNNNCQITYPTIIIFLVLVNFGLSILFSSKQGETATKNAVIKVNINLQKPII